MENLIKEVFKKKLENGDIEAIIEKEIDDMIKSILRDQMSWNGEIKKVLEERMKPLMIQAISECDLSKSTDLVKSLLNSAIKDSPVESLKDTLSGIKELYTSNDHIKKLKYGETIKLTEIFDIYCESLKNNEPYSKDDLERKDIRIDYDEGVYSYIEVTLEVEYTDYKTLFGTKEKQVVTIHSELMDEDEDIVFDLTKSYDGSYRLDFNTSNMLLQDLIHLDPFVTTLIAIQQRGCKIEIDQRSLDDSVCVEVEV